MMMLWLYDIAPFVLVFILALLVSLLCIPIAQYLSIRFKIVSIPGGRRQEAIPMPKLGSIVLFCSFTLAILVAQLLPLDRQDPNEVVRLMGLLLGSIVIFIGGLLDDLIDLNYIVQFAIQIVTAGIAIGFQIFIEFFNNPFTGQPTGDWHFIVTITLTVFWLGLMMNTVNFLDGSDGLAAGVAFIASLMLFLNSMFFVEPAQKSVAMLPLALMGSCLGFLLFNFYPAKIYMGGGALYLGYLLGTLSIIGGAKMATILLVMGLPLMDLAWQAFNRLRKGRNPFSGDRGHIHFRLLDSGRVTPRQLALGYYTFCAFFGFLTLILPSQLYKFIAFGVMLIIIAIAFAMVGRLKSYSSSSSE
jgi:UDP-GlcNAc:undecaprenyl-phosphate/decaprenyl-phosphate GlcNAc-1-phosphate transferase